MDPTYHFTLPRVRTLRLICSRGSRPYYRRPIDRADPHAGMMLDPSPDSEWCLISITPNLRRLELAGWSDAGRTDWSRLSDLDELRVLEPRAGALARSLSRLPGRLHVLEVKVDGDEGLAQVLMRAFSEDDGYASVSELKVLRLTEPWLDEPWLIYSGYEGVAYERVASAAETRGVKVERKRVRWSFGVEVSESI